MPLRPPVLLALSLAGLASLAHGDALTNVPEASTEGFVLVYSLDIPNNGNFRDGTPVPYTTDNSATAPAFDRIAYYLELDNGSGTQWVYASMDAFTADATAIGLPHNVDNPVVRQQLVANMNVDSNVPGIATGSGLGTGNIEMWPSNYNASNPTSVPNASGSTYDFGDGGPTTAAGYGSFQVHNHDLDGAGPGTSGQVLLAYNRWGTSSGSGDDLGIGNSSGANPDYTFEQNADDYTSRRLEVYIREPQ